MVDEAEEADDPLPLAVVDVIGLIDDATRFSLRFVGADQGGLQLFHPLGPVSLVRILVSLAVLLLGPSG
jgi:hypothetical protein